ncbi:MAG: oligosaccharide flippase family protein [Patescibacteria group bacterium]|nr:oligosaccharide flippase family protein [Patescibacteria group bacterium]
MSVKNILNSKINLLFSDQLFRGSFLVFVASIGSAAMNYLFHLLMGRFLAPAEYGVLMSLISLSYLTSVPGSTLVTTATKFASKYKAREDFDAVTHALYWATKVVSIFGLFIFGLAIVFRGKLATFLKIPDSMLVVLFFLFIFVSLLGSSPRGFLQGLLRFKAFSFVSLFTTFLKLALGVGFVLMGWGVFGAVGGLVGSSLLGLLVAIVLLRKNLRWPFKKNSFSSREILAYAAPTVLVLLCFQSLYNTDVILVKHFFTSHQAGIYSSAVTLGRIIYFGFSSVAMVMFPMVSEKLEQGQDFSGVFKKSFALVLAGAFLGWLAYTLIPSLLVHTFFGASYAEVTPYLSSFALFMGLFSLVNFLIQFFLSIRDFRFLFTLAGAALLQIFLIWQFHANLQQVIHVNIGVALTVLVALLWIYAAGTRNPRPVS